MTEKIRSRQQQILKLLLENKAGLSIDEIATALNISRNAVQQHFACWKETVIYRLVCLIKQQDVQCVALF